MKGAIIIPCFNEAERLDRSAVSAFLAANPQVDIWFVNDGSTDGTRSLLESIYNAHWTQISLIHQKNAGKAEAVRNGILQAYGPGIYDWLAYLDADLSAPLQEITRLADILLQKKLMIAAGIRLKHVGAAIKRNFWRHIASRILLTFCYQYLRLPNYDTQCGAKVFAKEAVPLLFSQPFKGGWVFDMEIFSRAQSHWKNEYQSLVNEIPLHTWNIKAGSKFRIRELVKLPGQLYSIKHPKNG